MTGLSVRPLEATGTLQEIRAYTVRHSEGEKLKSFIGDYRNILQQAVDEVWSRITWREKSDKGRWKGIGDRRDATRRIPFISSEGSFKHHELRNTLMQHWATYSKHYVDSGVQG